MIDEVGTGVDDQPAGTVPTFVTGPKAIHAAESYVLDLFQLFPTVYFHKTTRGAEKIFVELLVRLVEEIQKNGVKGVGLPARHPLVRFAKAPDNPERILQLDDTVIWGSLSQLRESRDGLISSFARRLQDRRLFKCVDLRTAAEHKIDPDNLRSPELMEEIDRCCANLLSRLREVAIDVNKQGTAPSILLDSDSRSA